MTPYIFGVTHLLTISAFPALFNSRIFWQLTSSPAPSLDLPTSWRPARLVQAQLRLQLGSIVPFVTPRHGRSLRPPRGSSFALQVRLCKRTVIYRCRRSNESCLYEEAFAYENVSGGKEEERGLIQLRRVQLIVEDNFMSTVCKAG
jgi:hypothetical protein